MQSFRCVEKAVHLVATFFKALFLYVQLIVDSLQILTNTVDLLPTGTSFRPSSCNVYK